MEESMKTKMKITDIIRKTSDEQMAQIIGAVIAMHTEGIPIEEAMKTEYPATLKYLQSKMEIDFNPTIADKIRAMSDEELTDVVMCPNETGLADIVCDHSDNCDCSKCTLDFLRSKAEE